MDIDRDSSCHEKVIFCTLPSSDQKFIFYSFIYFVFDYISLYWTLKVKEMVWNLLMFVLWSQIYSCYVPSTSNMNKSFVWYIILNFINKCKFLYGENIISRNTVKNCVFIVILYIGLYLEGWNKGLTSSNSSVL